MNVVTLLSNKVWGGGERYALDLCRRLAANGHSVAVVSRGIEAVDAPFRAADIPVGRLPLRGAFDIVSPLRLAKVLDHMAAPVVVHVHNFKDATTALRARRLMHDPSKVRVVCTRHLVKPAKTSRTSQRLYNELDALVFVSQTALDAFMSTHPAVDPAKVHVVHNAIELPAGGLPEKAEKSPGQALTVLYAGRISPEKGLDVLIDAMAKLPPDITLEIAGTGTPRTVELLEQRCKSLGLSGRVKWLGHVGDIFTAMARADIGVVPSVCVESFGLVVLEYMSMGVPVVATRAGGPAEIITDGTDGILVPPGDAGALADAIGALAADPARRAAIAEAGRRCAAGRFGYEQFYKRMENIYENTRRD